MNYFWTNTIWYLILGALTIFELTFILSRVNQRKYVFAFYLTISGIVVVIFEQVVFLFARGYNYYPKILPLMPLYDNLVGKVFSQMSVSATALFIAVFDFNFLWILIFAGMYGLIEQLFLALGIYKHNWYQTWITVVSLVTYFWLSRKYFAILLKGIKPIVHILNMFTGLFTLFICSPIPWSFLICGVQTYVPDQFPDPFIYTILIINGFFVLLTVPMMLVYFFKLKWYWNAVAILALYGVMYMAYKELNLFWFKNDWWFLIFVAVNICWVYFTVVVLDNFYKSVEPV